VTDNLKKMLRPPAEILFELEFHPNTSAGMST
jgi:hypothetical protein